MQNNHNDKKILGAKENRQYFFMGAVCVFK